MELGERTGRMWPTGDRPLVSIVTPSFNQGHFIAETIASVLTQDYPHVQYLVIDGGSTDGTVDVLRRYGNRLSWVSEPDRGQSDAINKGWRRAQGEIIAWLNADDLYRPGAIRKVVEFFREYPHIDLVYGDSECINERGEVLAVHRTRQVDGAELLRSPVSIIAQPATFLRGRVLKTVGYLDETLHYVMDFEYWVRVASRHNIAYLPECLAAYRVHEESKSIRHWAFMREEHLHACGRFFESVELPDALRQLERETMSEVHYRAANTYFLAGDMEQARRHAMAGWQYLPWKPRRSLLKVLGLGFVGPQGVQLAAWLKGFLS